MSWKSITCVAVMCALMASQALALPALDVRLSGGATPVLDGQGRLVWVVGVDVDETLFETTGQGTGGSVGMDIGFTLTGMNVASAAAVASNFDTNIPGASVFGDETADGDGDFVGVQAGTNANDVLAALGSIFFTEGGVKDALTITMAPLSTANLTTTISWGGAYNAAGGAGSTHGLLAQDATGDPVTKLGVQGSLSYTATPGDANLTGGVGIADLNAVLNNFGSGTTWQLGRFNGPGVVGIGDLNAVLNNFGSPSGVLSGAGALTLSATNVPEPSAFALVAVPALLVGAAYRNRRKNNS